MKRKQTMDDLYGDGSDHEVCPACGFCIPCGDCKNFGCGSSKRMKKGYISKHASSLR